MDGGSGVQGLARGGDASFTRCGESREKPVNGYPIRSLLANDTLEFVTV